MQLRGLAARPRENTCQRETSFSVNIALLSGPAIVGAKKISEHFFVCDLGLGLGLQVDVSISKAGDISASPANRSGRWQARAVPNYSSSPFHGTSSMDSASTVELWRSTGERRLTRSFS